MELGGHAPVLIFDDCDLEKAITLSATTKFRNAGQVCISPTRFYVQEGVYDRFVAGFAAHTKKVQVGNGLDAGTVMGPLANGRRPSAIAALVEDATSKGRKAADRRITRGPRLFLRADGVVRRADVGKGHGRRTLWSRGFDAAIQDL